MIIPSVLVLRWPEIQVFEELAQANELISFGGQYCLSLLAEAIQKHHFVFLLQGFDFGYMCRRQCTWSLAL